MIHYPNCSGLLLGQTTSLASPAPWHQISYTSRAAGQEVRIFLILLTWLQIITPSTFYLHVKLPASPSSCHLAPLASTLSCLCTSTFLFISQHILKTLTSRLPLYQNSCHYPGWFQNPGGWFILVLQPVNSFTTMTSGPLNHHIHGQTLDLALVYWLSYPCGCFFYFL